MIPTPFLLAHASLTGNVKTGKFPPATSGIIRKASMLREKSDYEDFFEPEMEETADTINQVETFLKDAEAYLRIQNVIE